MPDFKSFDALATHVADRRFEEVLAGKFDRVASGDFKTDLPGIDSVSLIRPPAVGGKPIENLHAVLCYTADGSPRQKTFTILHDGVLAGPIPKELTLTREEIREEILRLVETIDQDFFVEIDDEILPAGHSERPEPVNPKRKEHPKRPVTDTRRIEYMREQPNSLFGFRGRRNGFKGYYGFVFPDRLVLECDEVGNAIYVVRFGKPIDVKPEVFKRPPAHRIPQEEREHILESCWKPFAGQPKQMLRKMGAQQIFHPDTELNDDEWRQKMGRILAEN